MADELKLAVIEIRKFLFDLDNEAPLVDPDVLATDLATALSWLNAWRPLRKLATLSIVTDNFQYQLPGDWIEIELDSFNHAVNPSGLHFNWNGYQFELGFQQAVNSSSRPRGLPFLGGGLASMWSPFGITTPPYGAPSSVSFGILFTPGTRFEFAQDAAGAPIMLVSPQAAKAGDLKFLYQARHAITNDDAAASPEPIVGVNTVRPEDRGLLWAKTGAVASLSMARKVAGNRYATKAFIDLSEKCEDFCKEQTSERIAWAG